MSSDLEPLDGDVRGILDDLARLEADEDAAIVARLRNRFDIALAVKDAAPPTATPTTPTPRTKDPELGDAAPSPMPGGSTVRRALSLVGTFAAGAIVALAADRALAPPPVSTPPVVDAAPPAASAGSIDLAAPAASAGSIDLAAPAAPATENRSPAAGTPASVQKGAPSGSRAAPAPLEPTRDAGPRDGDLAAETRLVDTARSALAHRDFGAALEAATSHERRFPVGRLTEERDAIIVQALAGLHRGEEAKTRAKAFRTRHPESFFLPIVDRAVAPFL